MLYAKGDGVPQDNVLAYIWFSLAGANGPFATELHDALVKKMTPVQIAQAQRLARRCQDTKFKEC